MMTTKELENKVNVRSLGSGQYKVTIEWHNTEYTCVSNNSMAYDRIKCNDIPERKVYGFYTYKGALEAFYNECRRKYVPFNTAEILAEIEDNGGFDNFQHWNKSEIAQWVKASFGCSTYVARNVAMYIK